MNNPLYSIFYKLLAIVLVCVAIGCKRTPSEQILLDFKQVLKTVEDYQYGDSRSWLQHYNDVLAEIYNEPTIQPGAEKLMIRLLESDASLPYKQLICKSISPLASSESLGVLQKMLKYEETSHMAIIALQPLPYGEVDEILIQALTALQGHRLAGVINALAIRNSVEAVSFIEPLINDSDPMVAQAAIFTLGKIGGKQSVNVLYEDFQQAPKKMMAEALIMALEDGLNEQALEVYQTIYNANLSVSIKTAAFQGLLNHQPEEEKISFLIDVLRSGDNEYRESLIQVVRKLPAGMAMDELIQALPTFSAPFQQNLMLAIADRGDVKVRPFAIQQLSSPDQEVRISGLKALKSVSKSSDISMLAKIAANAKGAEQELARSCIYWMKSAETDQEIINLAKSSDPAIKSELIRAIGYRKIEEGLPYTIGQISSSNAEVRLAAIESAGLIGTKDVLNAVKSNSLTGKIGEQEAKIIIDALTRISLNSGDLDWCASQLNESFAVFSNETPLVILIATLGNIGTDAALEYIKPFLTWEEGDVQFASLKALSTWQNDAPLPDLETYLKTGEKLKNRQMAQVGVVNLVQNSGKLTNDQKAEKLQTSFLGAQSTAEKIIVLNGISRIYSLKAMDFVMNQLNNSDLSSTAQETFIRIADNLKYSYEDIVIQKIDSLTEIETDERFKTKLKLLKRSIEL